MKKKLLVGLLLCCSVAAWAEWGAEWLYCRSGFRLDYSYANVGGPEKYPLGFQGSFIIGLPEAGEIDFEAVNEIDFEDAFLGISLGANMGGTWKKNTFEYTKDNYDYSLRSNFYCMPTIGIESGFMALQCGFGLCTADYSMTGHTQMTAEGAYFTPIEYHSAVFFMTEPAAYFYVPVIAGMKLAVKVGYQFVPAAPVLNGLVIGGGIRL